MYSMYSISKLPINLSQLAWLFTSPYSLLTTQPWPQNLAIRLRSCSSHRPLLQPQTSRNRLSRPCSRAAQRSQRTQDIPQLGAITRALEDPNEVRGKGPRCSGAQTTQGQGRHTTDPGVRILKPVTDVLDGGDAHHLLVGTRGSLEDA